MESSSAVPNLPHFRGNRPRLRGRGGDFKFNAGTYFFEQVPQQEILLELQRKSAATSLAIRQGSAPRNTAGADGAATMGAPTANFVMNSGLVLQFDAYFKETVDESPLENHRVRRCKILVYLEDSSMQIEEYKEENSGMPQGTLVKRHRIPYPEERSGCYTLDDVSVGCTIDVYGRRFHVVDADGATRDLLRQRLGRIEAPALSFPTDHYTLQRKEFMSRETGCDPNVQHKITKNDMKVFAEASLGNTVDNSKRAGFMKYNRNVLRFGAVWDDRDSLYGDIRRFEMHYFLADDTIELRALHGPNCGRDLVPLMVKRGKVPKCLAGDSVEETYHWRDFDVGTEVNIYERKLVLIDADQHTRDFYASMGIHLGDPISSPTETEPTYKGSPRLTTSGDTVTDFIGGDEDDELVVSRPTSLIPGHPRRIRGEDVLFRYTAKMKTDVPENVGRCFVVTYHKVDRTVVVREPPRRNSGIVGGTFLSRMKVKDTDGNVLKAGSFYVGAEVTIHKHCFRIMSADDKTLKLMEERSRSEFPFSEPVEAAERLAGPIGGRTKEIRASLREEDRKGTGEASYEVIRRALESAGVKFGPAMPEQALITVMRAVGGTSRSASYERLLVELEEPMSLRQNPQNLNAELWAMTVPETGTDAFCAAKLACSRGRPIRVTILPDGGHVRFVASQHHAAGEPIFNKAYDTAWTCFISGT